MPLSKDLREFIESLNSNEVDYLVVGASRSPTTGIPATRGMDILVRLEPENIARLLKALDRFGFGAVGIDGQDFYGSGRIVQLGVPPNRIDLIPPFPE